jgi:hypothetical protein
MKERIFTHAILKMVSKMIYLLIKKLDKNLLIKCHFQCFKLIKMYKIMQYQSQTIYLFNLKANYINLNLLSRNL